MTDAWVFVGSALFVFKMSPILILCSNLGFAPVLVEARALLSSTLHALKIRFDRMALPSFVPADLPAQDCGQLPHESPA